MSNIIIKSLFDAQKYIYELLDWQCTNVQKDAESQEYGACSFELNGKKIIFRVAKITPTKVGQFVTCWKRIGKGSIMPYDLADSFDFFVVNVQSKDRLGQFVFPKQVLYEKGIISKNGSGGKRAIRVYPAWDITDSAQAKRTQEWQLRYFFEVGEDNKVDKNRVESLYQI